MDANESIDQDDYLNLQYLNSFDISYLEQMRQNMMQAKESLEQVNIKDDYIKQLVADMNSYENNMQQIIDNNMQIDAGDSSIRKQLNDTRTELEAHVSTLANMAGWVDVVNGMLNVGSLQHEVEVIDGKEYIKAVYTGEMPGTGRHNSFLVRIGAASLDYTANAYLTELSFSANGVTEHFNLAEYAQSICDSSYGAGLQSMAVTSFAEKDALEANINFVAANQAWEEVTFKIPTATFNMEDYDTVSYTIYFENLETVQWLSLGGSMDGKYDIYGKYSSIISNEQYYNSAVLYGNEEEAANLYSMMENDIMEALENMNYYFSSSESLVPARELMQKYQQLLASLKEMNDQIVSLNRENDQLKSTIKSSLSVLEEYIVHRMESSQIRSMSILLLVALCFCIVIGCLSCVIVKEVRKNFRNFSEVLQVVGKGNLKVRAAEDGTEEFKQFGKTLNKFLDQLSGALGSVQQVSKELTVKNNEIAQAIKVAVEGSDDLALGEQKKGILQLQQMFEEIGSSVSNQSASTEESLASLYAILEASKHAVEEINETTQASEESLKLVQAGATEITVLTDKMDGIAKSVEQASEEITELIHDSKKIEEVLDAIENLASQTNLLSLNASIEASRAGEEGRGFAVVADEVKKLSGETTKETHKISDIINSINSKIKQVQKANEQVIAHVEETHKIAEQFAEVIQNMNDSTVLSAECISNLRERMNNQMVSTEEIVKAVDQISMEAQDIQSRAIETEEISRNLTDMLVENLEHVEDITECSNQMDERVQFFEV